MKCLVPLLLALVLSGPQPARVQGEPGWIGAYIWGAGAMITTRSPPFGPGQFHDSVRFMLSKGFDTIRFTISPSAVNTQYNLPTSSFCLDDRRLGCFARLMLASDAWDHPNLRRVMVTAHDFTTLAITNNNIAGYVDLAVLNPNAAAIQAEYRALLQALEDRFATRPDIGFILSNWEGENIVYCGSIYYSMRTAAGAARCTASFPPGQTNAERVSAFLRWWEIRDAAIAEFQAAYPNRRVIGAPEFLGLDFIRDGSEAGSCGGYCDRMTDTVARQIELAGGREYCSYSSYNSQGPHYLERLTSILSYCRKLIIGEFGRHRPTHTDEQIAEQFRQADAARRISFPDGRAIIGVVPWRAIDCAPTFPGCPATSGGRPQRFGLFNSDGSEQLYPLMGPLMPTRPEATGSR
jgi:hypothetical protein